MTRLEWCKSDFANIGLHLGTVSPDVITKYIRYSIFVDYVNKGHNKVTAIQLTADECKCHTDTIYKALEFFS